MGSIAGKFGNLPFAINLKVRQQPNPADISPTSDPTQDKSYKNVKTMIAVSLVLNIVNLCIGLIIEPIVRSTNNFGTNRPKPSESTKDFVVELLKQISIVIDTIFRIGFFAVSVIQLFMKTAGKAQNAPQDDPLQQGSGGGGILQFFMPIRPPLNPPSNIAEEDSAWMKNMALWNMIALGVMTFWR